MAILDCRVVAIEGTHGAGKSTLAHALTAELKTCDINAACVGDLARRSPFVEGSRIHGKPFSIWGELHLLATQLAEEVRMARYHEVLICDKSVASIVGYGQLLDLSDRPDAEMRLRDGIQAFCQIYATLYDAVIFTHDAFDPTLTNDPYRPDDRGFQASAYKALLDSCEQLTEDVIHLPTGLPLREQVLWLLRDERVEAVLSPKRV